MEKTEIMKRYIHRDVQIALMNSRLPHDHPIGTVLESEAEIVGEAGAACVRVIDAGGNWVMLETRIHQLKSDPQFRVPNPEKVARGDESGVAGNFSRIASGDVEVV